MDSFKKLNVVIAITLGVLAMGAWYYWQTVCGAHSCTTYQMKGVLQPLLWGSAAWAITFTMLLAFPGSVFKKWLYFVASWGIVASIYLVLINDPILSGPLVITRGRVAWFTGVLMAGVSALFIVGWYILARVRNTTPPAPASRLLALVVAAAVLYYLSVM